MGPEKRMEAVEKAQDVLAHQVEPGLRDCETQLGVSREELQKPVDRVGNSAAAVRKELAV